MIRNRFMFVFLVLIICQDSWSQPIHKILNGKVSTSVSESDGIYVINLRTEKSVLTEKGGYFTIPATAGDTLLFSEVSIVGKRIGLTSSDFEKELFFVRLEPMINPLNEVVVRQYTNINAEALGIIPKGQKKYTPAERKVATASSGKMNPMGLDPLVNWMTGRTAMLKKELEIEKKEFWLQLLEEMFETRLFVENLHIPSDYVDGFRRYIVEDRRLVNTLKTKNKTMATFIMGELAVEYNQIIACETE